MDWLMQVVTTHGFKWKQTFEQFCMFFLIEATASIIGIALTGLVITGRACVTDSTYEVYVVQRVAFSMFGITGSR